MKSFLLFTSILLGLQRPSPEIISQYCPEKPKIICQDIHCLSDSICESIGVPPELVFEIGQNESSWRYIANLSGGSDYGDLQVIDITFWYWHSKLDLKGGKTRLNYLICGIHYLRWQYDRYNSWYKARFAYARGSYRPEYTWSALEIKFMSKHNWSHYD